MQSVFSLSVPYFFQTIRIAKPSSSKIVKNSTDEKLFIFKEVWKVMRFKTYWFVYVDCFYFMKFYGKEMNEQY